MNCKVPDIRLIATDIDGTFLSPQRMPTEKTVQAVRDAQQRGIRVCACTGRNHTELEACCAMGNLDDFAVINNGASIINWRTGAYKLLRRFDKGHIHDILRALLRDASHYPGVALSVTGGFHTHVWRGCCDQKTRRRYRDLWKLDEKYRDLFRIYDDSEAWMEAAGEDAQRINYTLPTAAHSERIQTLLDAWGGAVVTSAKATRMEIVPVGTGKADALKKLCALYGVNTENLMAIGDGANDADMLDLAGFGVAMGNAEPALKNRAHAVTGTNGEDGFANALYRYALDGAEGQ